MRLLASVTADQDGFLALRRDAAHRKATDNMLWALAASWRVLAQVAVPRDWIDLVLDSRHGELETTKEFLRCMDRDGVARPFLFQNSLHNATTGFLAIQLGLHGASVTLSHGQSLGPALDTARVLLSGNSPRVALVIEVEGAVPDFSILGKYDSFARAHLLANPAAVTALGLADATTFPNL